MLSPILSKTIKGTQTYKKCERMDILFYHSVSVNCRGCDCVKRFTTSLMFNCMA